MTIYWCIKCKSEFKNSRESLMDGMNCPACRGCLLPKHEYLERDENEIDSCLKYQCLQCDHEDFIRMKRKKYSEVAVCPKCNGAFVDIWKNAKYKRGGAEKVNPSLLTIELENESSVPKVFYKGEEIEGKIKISFDWETKTEELGGVKFHIEHAGCKEILETRTIGHKIGKFALCE